MMVRLYVDPMDYDYIIQECEVKVILKTNLKRRCVFGVIDKDSDKDDNLREFNYLLRRYHGKNAIVYDYEIAYWL